MRVAARLLAGVCVVAAVLVGVPGIATAAVPGLQQRVDAAGAFAGSRGTTLALAVYDRLTGEYADNGAIAHTRIESASVMKVFIADSVLRLRDAGRTTLTQADVNDMAVMLRSSDNAPANRLWVKYGANGIISDVKARYGLIEIGPTSNTRYWGNVLITAQDMVSYYDRLLAGVGGLSPASRDFILEQLRLSTPHGSDGHWQFFGLRDGLPREATIRQKQGWMCCVNGAVHRHSTGLVGPDNRFVVAALSKEPSGLGSAHLEQSLTGALRAAFPEGLVPTALTGIDQAWLRTGGGGGRLGQPTRSETPLADGAFRSFHRGSIYWSPQAGVHWILGAILESWARQRWETGPLGYPTSDEISLPGRPGAFQEFQRGASYWSPSTGAHWVSGSILDSWATQGYERGRMGLPTSDPYSLAGGGAFNRFEGGAIYSSPTTGAHWILGAIQKSWGTQGWERGPLGYPTTDEIALTGRPGAFQEFQDGVIYWSPSTGAHWVSGGIADAWTAQGAERGRLGLPTSDRFDLRSGVSFNRFQGGAVYSSTSTGAHAVLGAIHDSWGAQGWEHGPLGLPTSDETALVGRTGAYNTFQHGAVYSSPSTGTHWLAGPAFVEWTAQGGATGPLGLPTSDPTAVDGGTRVVFEGGTVSVATGGAVTTVLDPP